MKSISYYNTVVVTLLVLLGICLFLIFKLLLDTIENKEVILCIVGVIVSSIISIVFALFKQDKNEYNTRDDVGDSIKKERDVNENLFKDMFDEMKDDEKKKKIQSSLDKIKKEGFLIDLYEIQTEIERSEDYERKLKTICSNYIVKESIAKMKKIVRVGYLFKRRVYKGQTTYAFDKNKDMWIVSMNKGLLDRDHNSDVKYMDKLNEEQNGKIPDFWVMDPEMDIKIRTLAIFQLRCEGSYTNSIYSNFGFISFGSNEYVCFNKVIKKEFEKIAKLFAFDLLAQGIENQMKMIK